jgi:FkbM family methyltransferase
MWVCVVVAEVSLMAVSVTENGWAQQAEIFPAALGAKADVLKMWGGGTGASLVKGWAGIPDSYVTQVPVLTLDRILGSALQGKRYVILVDVEGAEYAMLQGATQTLQNNPRPIWMMEIGSIEHQPSGVRMNPNLVPTFEIFFERGYTAATADSKREDADLDMIRRVAEGNADFGTNNFVFR